MFDDWFLRRAARKYANLLPRQLLVDFGHDKFCTEPQIRNAIADCGLNFRYAVLGYARYLTPEHFAALKIKLDVVMGYDEARALFIANEPVKVASQPRLPPAPFDASRLH